MLHAGRQAEFAGSHAGNLMPTFEEVRGTTLAKGARTHVLVSAEAR